MRRNEAINNVVVIIEYIREHNKKRAELNRGLFSRARPEPKSKQIASQSQNRSMMCMPEAGSNPSSDLFPRRQSIMAQNASPLETTVEDIYDDIMYRKYRHNRQAIVRDAIQIFRKQKNSRNKFDVTVLCHILQEFPFFKDMILKDKEKPFQQICKISQLVHYEPTEVIFQQGQRSDCFYIIISGEVQLWINKEKAKKPKSKTPWIKQERPPTPPSSEEPPPLPTEHLLEKKDLCIYGQMLVEQIREQEVSFRPQIHLVKCKDKVQEWDDKSLFFSLHSRKNIKTLIQGMSFGELGIIGNMPRSATAIAKTSTLLLCINQHNFNQILKSFEQEKLELELQNVCKFPLIRSLEEKESKKLYFLLQKQEVRKDEIIYEEGHPAELVYFIDQGEFQLSRLHDEELYQAEEYQDTQSLYQRQVHLPKQIPILHLREGGMFGDLEVMLDVPRSTRATCLSSSGLLYYLPRETFLKVMDVPTFYNLYAKKALYQDNKFRKDNVIKNNCFDQIDSKLGAIKDRGYFDREVLEFVSLQQHGDRRFQQEQVSNYLLHKYKFKLLKPQRKSRFKSIYQGLEEYEKELDLGEGKGVSEATDLVEVEKIKKNYLVKILKKDEQVRAKEFSNQQMVMGNIGLGLKSAKQSKHHYFKKGMPTQLLTPKAPRINPFSQKVPLSPANMHFQSMPFQCNYNVHNAKHFGSIRQPGPNLESRRQSEIDRLQQIMQIRRFQNKKRVYSSLNSLKAVKCKSPTAPSSTKQAVIHEQGGSVGVIRGLSREGIRDSSRGMSREGTQPHPPRVRTKSCIKYSDKKHDLPTRNRELFKTQIQRQQQDLDPLLSSQPILRSKGLKVTTLDFQ